MHGTCEEVAKGDTRKVSTEFRLSPTDEEDSQRTFKQESVLITSKRREMHWRGQDRP